MTNAITDTKATPHRKEKEHKAKHSLVGNISAETLTIKRGKMKIFEQISTAVRDSGRGRGRGGGRGTGTTQLLVTAHFLCRPVAPTAQQTTETIVQTTQDCDDMGLLIEQLAEYEEELSYCSSDEQTDVEPDEEDKTKDSTAEQGTQEANQQEEDTVDSDANILRCLSLEANRLELNEANKKTYQQAIEDVKQILRCLKMDPTFEAIGDGSVIHALCLITRTPITAVNGPRNKKSLVAEC